jgi:hypothetical protein
MNLNTSVEFHTISMEQQSKPLNLTQENPPQNVSLLEHTTQQVIQSPILQTGEILSNQILIPSEPLSQSKSEIRSANPSSSLRSHVKPHVLLEKAPELRILKVSREDIKQFSQVIAEFQEQFIGY